MKRKRVDWAEHEWQAAFVKADELLSVNKYLNNRQLTEGAQQALTADKHHVPLYSSFIAKFCKLYRQSRGLTPTGRTTRTYTRRLPTPITPLALPPVNNVALRFCPSCGFNLAHVKIS